VSPTKPPPPPQHPVEEDIVHALEPDGRLPLPALVRRWALRIVPLVLLAAASVVLWREFRHLSFEEVAGAMRAWGWGAILMSLALSFVSFVLMGVVEWLGLRWVGARLPWGPTMAGSFLANAIAHSLGANLLVSGAIRARLYDRYGVTLTQVAATTLFAGMSFAVGIAALGGMGLLFASREALAASAISTPVARGLGAALLTGAGGYVVICAVRRAPLQAFGRSVQLPTPLSALAQLVIGVADNGIAAAIIWTLLPHGAVSYLTFVGAYAVAAVAGLISTVPAGAGVFEGSMSALLNGVAHAPLAAAFLGYRLAYYLLPLVIAVIALAGDTLKRAKA
jgi:uncharacterized membrane protein YbhN (UPF0104 family)